MEFHQKIFLWGMMGSGKSTRGKQLAKAQGWRFIDLDNQIIKQNGGSIPDLFNKYGEKRFRELESKALNGILNEERIVVATGGGTPCHDLNRQLMLNHGLCIYLKADTAFLRSRLWPISGNRPLLAGAKSAEHLERILENLFIERQNHYECAQLHEDAITFDPQEFVKKLSD